jgi:hypothetical protein
VTVGAQLKHRVFTLLCVLAAVAVLLIGISRGNARAGLVGAAVFLGYAVVQAVARRITPAARLLTGREADDREILAQYRATRLAGWVALVVAGLGVVLGLASGWDAGLYAAGAATLVVAAFAGGLWWYARVR